MTKQSTQSQPDRGDNARQKLIEAAIKIFGQYGFEGASTRQLASEASVNIAAIPYYFGGKEGLYFAVIDHIVEFFRASMGNAVDEIKKQLENPAIDDVQARALMHRFVGEMARFILGGRKERIHMSRIITREQLDPTPAFDRLYDGLLRRTHETLSTLVSRLTGVAKDDPTLKLRTQAIIGQIVSFKSSRETVLRNMGWKEFGDKEIDIVASVVRFHIDAIIDGYQSKKP